MKAFRCSRTGLLYPSDYVEEWGRKYGIGLGPVPISEALVNDYHRDIAGDMHGLSVARAQIDMVEVTEEEFIQNQAILDIDDPKYKARSDIMRSKQLLKSSKMQNRFPSDVEPARLFLEKRASVLKQASEE